MLNIEKHLQFHQSRDEINRVKRRNFRSVSMASCASCGQTILFGGKKCGDFVFCNDRCLSNGTLQKIAVNIPDDVILELAHEFHASACPICGGAGPIDVHLAYRVMSFVVLTRYQTIPQISCRRCGKKMKMNNALLTFALGWWGFPFGLILAPVYLIRNLIGIASPPSALEPSAHLKTHARLVAAQRIWESSQTPAGHTEPGA